MTLRKRGLNTKTSKRILVVLMLSFSLFLMTSGLSLENSSDTYFDFIVSRLQGSQYTSGRLNENKTSAYAKVTFIGKGNARFKLVLNNLKNVTQGGSVVATKGKRVCIHNSAYETYGKVDVRLGVTTEYAQVIRVRIKGAWSPDSVGCY